MINRGNVRGKFKLKSSQYVLFICERVLFSPLGTYQDFVGISLDRIIVEGLEGSWK